MLNFQIKMDTQLALELAEVLQVRAGDDKLRACCEILKDKLYRDAVYAQVADEAYLANELMDGEHIAKDMAIELASVYGEDVWNTVLSTAWAYQHDCLVDEGDALGTRLLINLTLMKLDGSSDNWNDVVRAVHKAKSFGLF